MSNLVIRELDKFLIHENKENERPTKHIHPSSFGGCLRKTAYDFYGVEKKEKDTRLLRIFKNGHHVHERIQQDCKLAGGIEVIGVEISVFSEEYQIKGYVDGIIGIEEDYYVLEIKSKNNKGFTKYLSKPEKNHIVQANIYLWLIKETMERAKQKEAEDRDETEKVLLKMKHAPQKYILLYENKDTQDQKEFVLDKNNEVIHWVQKRAKRFWEIVEKNKLPKRPYDIDVAVNTNKLPMECRYMCDYTRVCWNNIIDVDSLLS